MHSPVECAIVDELVLQDTLRLRVGCTFAYDLAGPSSALIQVAVQQTDIIGLQREVWEIEPPAGLTPLSDLYGNSLQRVVMPGGPMRLRYDAIVDVPGRFDEVDAGVAQHPIEDLPAEALHYLLASRYCVSDALMSTAWELFGDTGAGWARAQAICDWVHDNVEFQYGSSDPLTTAKDVFDRRRGVCRDFAHLFISFCRATNLPARYVFGYLPDLFVEPNPDPMDFCAWAEVYLGCRWWTFDPRNNQRRVGRVVVGRGRDAVDVAMLTTWGPATFRSLEVWADEAPT